MSIGPTHIASTLGGLKACAPVLLLTAKLLLAFSVHRPVFTTTPLQSQLCSFCGEFMGIVEVEFVIDQMPFLALKGNFSNNIIITTTIFIMLSS